MKTLRNLLVSVPLGLAALGLVGFLAWKLFIISWFVDPSLVRPGAFSPSPASSSASDGTIRWLDPSGFSQSLPVPDQASTILSPRRLRLSGTGTAGLPLYADPLGLIYNTHSIAIDDATRQLTWDRLWSSPVVFAGGDDVSFTQTFAMVSETLSSTDSFQVEWTALWQHPESAIARDGKLQLGPVLKQAVAFLRDRLAKGLLTTQCLQWNEDDVWLAVRDGRATVGLALYSSKRSKPEAESFSVGWTPLPAKEGRTDYAVGATIVAASVHSSTWNPTLAWMTAEGFSSDADRVSRSLSLVPLARGLAPFDLEARGARVGLSVAPVVVLPHGQADLPVGWDHFLAALRAGLK